MLNVKTCFVFLLIIAICYCEENRPGRYRRKKHHHHHLYDYHFFYYLAFLAIKLKIIFFLGTIFTISMVAGKVFALIKLTERMREKEHHHEEKIVYITPHDHGDHGYHSSIGFSGPGDVISEKGYSSYPSAISPEHYETNDRYSSTNYNKNRKTTSKYSSRKFKDSNDYFINLFNYIKKLNATDLIFKEMGINDEQCKQKFVCEADYISKVNILLHTGFNTLSDISYRNYQPKVKIKSLEECGKIFEKCKQYV